MSAIRSDSEPARSLADLAPGTSAVVGQLRFDEVDAVRLMELGFIPGMSVTCQRRVPLGDISVFQLDGSQIAIRGETASRIRIRPQAATEFDDAERA